MSVFFCSYHDRLEDSDFVGYHVAEEYDPEGRHINGRPVEIKDRAQYCDDAWEAIGMEEE